MPLSMKSTTKARAIGGQNPIDRFGTLGTDQKLPTVGPFELPLVKLF